MNILLVEDNPGDIALLKQHLKKDYYYEHTNKLSEAIQTKSIDLIILDLNLLDSKQENTLKSIYEDFSDVPIIVISGNSDPNLPYIAIKNGAQDFVHKDHFDSLQKAIDFAILRTQNIKEIRIKHETIRKQLEDVIKKLEKIGGD